MLKATSTGKPACERRSSLGWMHPFESDDARQQHSRPRGALGLGIECLQVLATLLRKSCRQDRLRFSTNEPGARASPSHCMPATAHCGATVVLWRLAR